MKKILFIAFLFVGLCELSAQQIDYNKVVNIFKDDLSLYNKLSFDRKEKLLKPSARLINKLKKVGSQPKGKELLIKMIGLKDEIDDLSSRKTEKRKEFSREYDVLDSQIETLNSKYLKRKREAERLKKEVDYYKSLAKKAQRNYNKYSSLGNANHYLSDAKKYDAKANSYVGRYNNYLRDYDVNELGQRLNRLYDKRDRAERNLVVANKGEAKIDALKEEMKNLKKQIEVKFVE